MTYSIGISSRPDHEIRSDHKQTMGRKKRTLILPSSVSFAEAEKFWESLVFHQRAGELEDAPRAFRPEGFTTVSASVEKYRELARAGRLLTERLTREEAGRPKIVLGEGVYVPEEDDLNLEQQPSDTIDAALRNPESSEPNGYPLPEG